MSSNTETSTDVKTDDVAHDVTPYTDNFKDFSKGIKPNVFYSLDGNVTILFQISNIQTKEEELNNFATQEDVFKKEGLEIICRNEEPLNLKALTGINIFHSGKNTIITADKASVGNLTGIRALQDMSKINHEQPRKQLQEYSWYK